MPLDKLTAALTTITYDHHEVHIGGAFVCSDVQNVNASSVQYLITTPDSPEIHMIFAIDCTGELLTMITEGADRTGTTLLPIINRKRNSEKLPFLIIHRGVSGGTTDGATTIYQNRVGATKIEQGLMRGLNKVILKSSTKYIITLTTFADEYVSPDLEWYEHTSLLG